MLSTSSRVVIALALGVVVAPLQAAPILLAQETLTGSTAGAGVDLSGQTARLENGLPGNVLGGIGSALAWAGGSTFVAAPDRGPNATPYNAAVDDTASYIARFQTLSMSLSANTSGSGLRFVLTPTLIGTTLLSSPTPLIYGSGAGLGNRFDGTPLGSGAPSINSATRNYFTGRSDNFGAGGSGNANDGRLDPEGTPRLERRQERVRVGRVRTLRLPVRSRDRRAHPRLHLAGQPGHRESERPGRRRDRGQCERTRGEQGHGRPRDHARRQDAGRHHAGAPRAGRRDRRDRQAVAHRHDRHRERHDARVRLQAHERQRRQRDHGLERSRVHRRRTRWQGPRRRFDGTREGRSTRSISPAPSTSRR